MDDAAVTREMGIRRTTTGWRAYGRVDGVFFSKCFPPETTLTALKTWRANERVRIRLGLREMEIGGAPTGSFRADVATYLSTVTAMPTYRERKQHLEEWAAVFGDRSRAAITSADVRAQLQRWRLDGYAASSVNHRRTALGHFFKVLDADARVRTINPVASVPRVRPPDAQPRGLPYRQVVAILTQARPHGLTKSYARLLVLAWTGLPPATLKRLRPEHWQRKAGRIWIPGRQKGKGTRPRSLPLTAEGTAAFRLLTQLRAWGSFDTSALNRAFKRAVKKVRPPVPGHPTLYDLRHSFGTAAYAATGDIQATAGLLGHADTRQTQRYVTAALDGRAKAALRAFRSHVGAEKLQRKLQKS